MQNIYSFFGKDKEGKHKHSEDYISKYNSSGGFFFFGKHGKFSFLQKISSVFVTYFVNETKKRFYKLLKKEYG